MGRRRKRDRHLPARVYFRHGRYYFVDCWGKWNPVGNSLGEMYRKYAEFVEDGDLTTMSAVLDRYLRDVVPQKAPQTQVNNRAQIARLRAVFGDMAPGEVRASHVCQYRDKRGAMTPTAANRELEVLAHVFRYAVEWGATDVNPCREVRKLRLAKRERYVEDWEFEAVYAVALPMMQVAMDLALLTGLRRGDLLALTRDNVTDDGLLVRTSKTGVPLLVEWTDELEEVVARARGIQPQVRRTLIANRQGRPYTPTGFGSNWRRLMDKALRETDLEEPYRFNDLRAKSASDDTMEAATERLGHMDMRTTQRFYRRKAIRVQPLRR